MRSVSARITLLIAACLWSSAAGALPKAHVTGAPGPLAIECNGAVTADRVSSTGTPPYNLLMSILAGGAEAADGETITISRTDGSASTTQECSSRVVHMNLAPGTYLMVVDVGGMDKAFLFGMRPAQPLHKLVLFFTPGTDA